VSVVRKRALLVAATFAAFLALGPGTPTAGAASAAQAVTGPTAKYYGYLTPVIVIQKGEGITYTNLDVERHNVTQDVNTDGVHGSSKRKWCTLFPAGKCPVFYSPLIGLGQSVSVRGLQYVKPGQVYTFYCTLHPGMKGHLIVAPAEAPYGPAVH
jgi:plastocyanin